MLADSSSQRALVQPLLRTSGASQPWHLAPSLQQHAGLPMLGSEPSSWGCFLPAGHVLSLSICCLVSPDNALGLLLLPKLSCLGGKEGCLLEFTSYF